MFIVIIMFIAVSVCALLIAQFVFRKLEKNDYRWANLISSASFVISFIMIAVTVVAIFMMNVDFHR